MDDGDAKGQGTASRGYSSRSEWMDSERMDFKGMDSKTMDSETKQTPTHEAGSLDSAIECGLSSCGSSMIGSCDDAPSVLGSRVCVKRLAIWRRLRAISRIHGRMFRVGFGLKGMFFRVEEQRRCEPSGRGIISGSSESNTYLSPFPQK